MHDNHLNIKYNILMIYIIQARVQGDQGSLPSLPHLEKQNKNPPPPLLRMTGHALDISWYMLHKR